MKNYLFNLNFQYSNKGVKSQGYTTKLPYLVLPIMIGFKPTKLFQIEGGVEFGYLLKYRDYHNDFDYGFNIGATFSIADDIKAGVRYNLGLNSIYGKEDLQFTDDSGNLIDPVNFTAPSSTVLSLLRFDKNVKSGANIC